MRRRSGRDCRRQRDSLVDHHCSTSHPFKITCTSGLVKLRQYRASAVSRSCTRGNRFIVSRLYDEAILPLPAAPVATESEALLSRLSFSPRTNTP